MFHSVRYMQVIHTALPRDEVGMYTTRSVVVPEGTWRPSHVHQAHTAGKERVRLGYHTAHNGHIREEQAKLQRMAR